MTTTKTFMPFRKSALIILVLTFFSVVNTPNLWAVTYSVTATATAEATAEASAESSSSSSASAIAENGSSATSTSTSTSQSSAEATAEAHAEANVEVIINQNNPLPPPPPSQDKATIIAYKIVCENESDLPNASRVDVVVGANSAADYVSTHENCELVSGWDFQWGPVDAQDPGGSFIGAAPTPWKNFPSATDGSGKTSITIPVPSDKIWIREVLKAGYLPFSGGPGNIPGSDVSAEMYCNDDVRNYDNYDFVDGIEANKTYYCVAFNVLVSDAPVTVTASLSALPGTVNLGATSTLTWSSTNATICNAPWTTATSTSGSLVVSPATTTAYSITCGNGTTSSTATTTVAVTPVDNGGNTPSTSISANPGSVTVGATSTLSWVSTNTNVCSAPWTSATSTSGTFIVSPATTTAYSIICGNGTASSTATTTVTVTPAGNNGGNTPSTSISANPGSITAGATSTLSWTSANTTSCAATWTTSTSTSGSLVVSPATTTAYSITCGNGTASSTATTTIAVTPVDNGGTPTPSVSLSADPGTINQGQNSTLSWTSTNTNTCAANWTSATSTSGSQVVTPQSTTSYSVTCGNGTASSTATTTVTVNTDNNGGGGGGGGGGSSRSRSSSNSTNTASCFYLRDYLRRDFDNDPIEVLKLQAFLINFEGHSNLALNGVFDQATFDAVSAFQVKYFGDILEPWGHTGPTGYVYILTLKKVNEIYCQRLFPINVAQANEIAAFRALLESLRARGIDVSLPPSIIEPSGTSGSSTSTTTPIETPVLPIVGQAEPSRLEQGIRNLAGVIFSQPASLLESAKCLYEFIIILVLLYILGSVLNDLLHKNVLENERKRFLTLWLTMDIGVALAIILAYIFGWYCLILPLLVVLAIYVVWTLTYPKNNSVKNYVKSWFIAVPARAKSVFGDSNKFPNAGMSAAAAIPVSSTTNRFEQLQRELDKMESGEINDEVIILPKASVSHTPPKWPLPSESIVFTPAPKVESTPKTDVTAKKLSTDSQVPLPEYQEPVEE